ncbi:MAG: glycosyltransferase family 4 protein [Lachnospiraceae bacterium]|nr:glycosyltransferase family 4 protein [Lachnospiraceae bacterium]
MQTIYVDVTNLTKIAYLTGIQRVVRSVSIEMYKKIPEKLCFISFDEALSSFQVLDSESFIRFINGGEKERAKIFTGESIMPVDMKPGDVFFELDAVWNISLKSSVLLPALKHRGVRIAVYVYDVLPINYPQFTHFSTRFNYINYIGSYLQYADAIITSSQSTLDSIHELADRLGLPRVPGFVSWHGSDFNERRKSDGSSIPEEVKEAVKSRYVLTVGTIEPRKNHAFLLDAFEKGLFDKDIKLIFAGKIGWNVEELEQRINNHPEKDKRFFHFVGLTDEGIDYLYSHAFLVAFPTYAEGFGLPIIESLERGTPVLATDIPVLREVGKEYCRYFKLNDIDDFTDKLLNLTENPEEYNKLKEEVGKFKPSTWEEAADKVVAALETLKPAERKAKKDIHQMVILTARVEDIARTIPYIEAYMPFIEKILLCCPDKVSDEMKAIPTKRIKIDTLTDGEILKGRPLPEDHGTRNFFLRCLAMQSDKVDDVFIMSDDDYRPVDIINPEVFIEDNSYVAYYCHDLNEWKGVVGAMSSYDYYIYRTRDFVNEHHYPGLQYSSHMPQIIEKELYLQMINEHKGIESTGLDEWSSYFNYVQAIYPDLIKSKPYICMCWPGLKTDWPMYVKPEQYLFENHYDFLYDKGRIFEGLSDVYSDKTDEENKIKIKRFTENTNLYFEQKNHLDKYIEKFKKDRLEIPSFSIFVRGDEIEIGAPEALEIPVCSIVHFPVTFKGKKEGLKLQLSIIAGKGTLVSMPPISLDNKDIEIVNDVFNATLVCGQAGTKKGSYALVVRIDDGKETKERQTALKLV